MSLAISSFIINTYKIYYKTGLFCIICSYVLFTAIMTGCNKGAANKGIWQSETIIYTCP